MSFALYCRATGGRRSFAAMRCMSAPEDLPTLVELDFSLQGETYRFRRSQYTYRKRNKETELRESHECFQWKEGDFQLLESGSESAVRRRAEELLHLTCEQFSQVIVLPQGDFLRLLRANSKDKGEMLKTLFSAGLWRQVTDRLHQRTRSLEEQTGRLSATRESFLRKEQAGSTPELEGKAAALAQREQALQQEASDLSKKHWEESQKPCCRPQKPTPGWRRPAKRHKRRMGRPWPPGRKPSGKRPCSSKSGNRPKSCGSRLWQ